MRVSREEKNLVVIDADILVERRSQQGIVLGAGAVAVARYRDCGPEGSGTAAGLQGISRIAGDERRATGATTKVFWMSWSLDHER